MYKDFEKDVLLGVQQEADCCGSCSWVRYVTPGGGKNAWNLNGEGEHAGNPRGFIAQNPRKVRGVHELRGI